MHGRQAFRPGPDAAGFRPEWSGPELDRGVTMRSVTEIAAKGFGLAAALLIGAAADAATFITTVRGVVTEQFVTPLTRPGATSPINVGDEVVATFRYTLPAGSAAGQTVAMFNGNLATFRIGGISWTSDADHLGALAPPRLTTGADPLSDYFSTMENTAGDLRIRRNSFTISHFGYDLYEGPGFRGTFDPATAITSEIEMGNLSVTNLAAVPELAMWAQLIAGFGAIGIAVRQRRSRRMKWQGLVARLSGRVREG